MNRIATKAIVICFLVFLGCKPKVATDFPMESDAEVYTAASIQLADAPDSTLNVMTWNIRFGIGRGPFWGDACGDKTIYTEDEIKATLDIIVDSINMLQPDVLMLQELDLDSKRSSYINELQYILDNTYFNYGYYGSIWRSEYVPVGGLGKVELGLATLTKWPMNNAKRIQLALRGDQDPVTEKMYLRYCYVKGDLEIPGNKDVTMINIHSLSYTTDDTKHKQMIQVEDELSQLTAAGKKFVIGGDFNLLPPNAVKTDYCIEEMCADESFHQPGDAPQHKEGSNYTAEMTWLSPFYNSYQADVSLDDYILNESAYFTQTTTPGSPFDRKLDYIFTNHSFVPGTVHFHHDMSELSDHSAVSIDFNIPQ